MLGTNGNKKLRKKIISQMPEEDQAYYKQPDIQDWYKKRFDDDEIERRKAWLRKTKSFWHDTPGVVA